MVAPFCGRPRPLGGPAWVAYSLFIRDSEPLATPAFPAALAQWMLWGCGAGRTDRSRLPRFLLHLLAPLLHLLLYLFPALLHLLLYLFAPLLYFLPCAVLDLLLHPAARRRAQRGDEEGRQEDG